MKICFMSKYQGASDLWFLFYETIISMLSRGDVICKIERHVKKLTILLDFSYQLWHSVQLTKKLSFLSETVWKIKENTKKQGKVEKN